MRNTAAAAVISGDATFLFETKLVAVKFNRSSRLLQAAVISNDASTQETRCLRHNTVVSWLQWAMMTAMILMR